MIGEFYRLMDVKHSQQLRCALVKTLRMTVNLEDLLATVKKALKKDLPGKYVQWIQKDRDVAKSYLPPHSDIDDSIFQFAAPERVALLFIMLSGCRPTEAEKVVAGVEGQDVYFETVVDPDEKRKYESIRIDSSHTKTGVDYVWGIKSPDAKRLLKQIKHQRSVKELRLVTFYTVSRYFKEVCSTLRLTPE